MLNPAMALPVILDTDVGMDVDDAFALAYAALEPRIDLRAVTTVNGDTQGRAAVARAILRLAGRPDVPVGAGATMGLTNVPHALMPLEHVDRDPVQQLVDEEFPPAADVLVDALAAADTPVTICTIGPLTNIAALAGSRPDLLERVARIQMMGGCLAPPGTAPDIECEFNVGGDPAALAVLLATPVPIGIVPIDATLHTWFSDEQRAVIRDAGPLGAVLDVLSENFLTMLAAFWPEDPKVRLHDPLTVVTLVEPEVATFEACRVAAVGTPGACRTLRTETGRTVDACTGADNERLTELLVRTLTAGG